MEYSLIDVLRDAGIFVFDEKLHLWARTQKVMSRSNRKLDKIIKMLKNAMGPK